MKKDLFVPFDSEGNMLDYSYHGISEEEKEICKENKRVEHFRRDGTLAEVFVPNYEFEDVLSFEYFSRGRSSVKAHFVSENTGLKYEMFISDFEDVLKSNRIANCRIKGKFTFVKKGQNYGVMLVEIGEE